MGFGKGRGGEEIGFKHGCYCCSFCVILIVSVSLFGASFDTLTPTEWGLEWDGIAQKLDETPQENGRYFLWLGHEFIKFPKRLQYVEFSESADGGDRNHAVNVWSKDGQEIVLELGFYYRLRKRSLADLYYTYKDSYLQVIENTAGNAARDVATNFTTLEFFTRRARINDAMAAEFQARIGACCFSDVPVFNLLGIDVPSGFDSAVLSKVIASQHKLTLSVEKEAAVIRQGIAVINARADFRIARANADAEKGATITRAIADANATTTVGTQRASALRRAAERLHFISGLANATATNQSSFHTHAINQLAFADALRSRIPDNVSLLVDVDTVLFRV